MKLRTHILVWVFLASIIPVTVLMLSLSLVLERRFLDEVDRSAAGSLQRIASEISNRLNYERALIRGIANATATQNFLPMLGAVQAGYRHPEYTAHRNTLTQFLLNLQRTVPGLGAIRILDAQGNTVIKVLLGSAGRASFDSIGPVPLMEEELDDPAFLQFIRTLPADEPSYAMIPQARSDLPPGGTLATLNAIQPLVDPSAVDAAAAPLGYLVVNTFGAYVDRILDYAPRPFDGLLDIIEANPEDPFRNGLLLYSDARKVRFGDPNVRLHRIVPTGTATAGPPPSGDGVYEQAGQRVYHTQLSPYPLQFIGWSLRLAVDSQALRAPYRTFRLALVGLAVAALLISLVLADLAARFLARPMADLAAHIKDYADGRPAVLAATALTTDEQQALERAFAYLAEQLDRAQHARAESERKLLAQAKLATLGELAAGIGHEINNPLSNVLNLTKLIERSLPPGLEHIQQDVRDLRAEAQRIERIVASVEDFARSAPPRRQRVELAAWLDHEAAHWRSRAHAEGKVLKLSHPEVLVAETDPALLAQILKNLVRNALQASPEHGRVDVALQLETGIGADRLSQLVFSVRDYGPGLSPEAEQRAFEPFFTTKPGHLGTGLGLAVSLALSHRLGGDLSLHNHPDGGAVARLILLFDHRTSDPTRPLPAETP